MNQEQIISLIEEELKITQLAMEALPFNVNERRYFVGVCQTAAYELILDKIKSVDGSTM